MTRGEATVGLTRSSCGLSVTQNVLTTVAGYADTGSTPAATAFCTIASYSASPSLSRHCPRRRTSSSVALAPSANGTSALNSGTSRFALADEYAPWKCVISASSVNRVGSWLTIHAAGMNSSCTSRPSTSPTRRYHCRQVTWSSPVALYAWPYVLGFSAACAKSFPTSSRCVPTHSPSPSPAQSTGLPFSIRSHAAGANSRLSISRPPGPYVQLGRTIVVLNLPSACAWRNVCSHHS